MDRILHHAKFANIDLGGRGARPLTRARIWAYLRGGAGFCPSTVSNLRFPGDVSSETGNVDFGFRAFFTNAALAVHAQLTAELTCRFRYSGRLVGDVSSETGNLDFGFRAFFSVRQYMLS